jgi:hypothetical protein
MPHIPLRRTVRHPETGVHIGVITYGTSEYSGLGYFYIRQGKTIKVFSSASGAFNALLHHHNQRTKP